MTVADPQRRGSPCGGSFDQQRPSTTICPFQKPVNKLLSLGLLVGLVFSSANQAHAQIVPLPTFNIEMDQTSISGLSSGGYMAVQFSVAFSALVKGVRVIAGGTLERRYVGLQLL